MCACVLLSFVIYLLIAFLNAQQDLHIDIFSVAAEDRNVLLCRF